MRASELTTACLTPDGKSRFARGETADGCGVPALNSRSLRNRSRLPNPYAMLRHLSRIALLQLWEFGMMRRIDFYGIVHITNSYSNSSSTSSESLIWSVREISLSHDSI